MLFHTSSKKNLCLKIESLASAPLRRWNPPISEIYEDKQGQGSYHDDRYYRRGLAIGNTIGDKFIFPCVQRWSRTVTRSPINSYLRLCVDDEIDEQQIVKHRSRDTESRRPRLHMRAEIKCPEQYLPIIGRLCRGANCQRWSSRRSGEVSDHCTNRYTMHGSTVEVSTLPDRICPLFSLERRFAATRSSIARPEA